MCTDIINILPCEFNRLYEFGENDAGGFSLYDKSVPEEYLYTIEGQIDDQVDDSSIHYLAAHPPDFRTGFSGSGLPFANEEQAFTDTPNKGRLSLNNGKYRIKVIYPNAFYMKLGTVRIPPVLYISYLSNQQQKTLTVKLGNGIPFRTLTYPNTETLNARSDCMFYKNDDLPVRNQWEILMDSKYPNRNVMPPNFWGSRPPM